MDLPKIFSLYLKTKGASQVTIKNYLSDLSHFLGWMELFLKGQNLPFTPAEPQFLNRYFNQNLLKRYQSYLINNSLPVSTINRRLSTLRTFAKFCLSQAWISENPTKEISNISGQRTADSGPALPAGRQRNERIIQEFKSYLETEKTSSNTIKNYLSDIREFLDWLEIIR